MSQNVPSRLTVSIGNVFLFMKILSKRWVGWGGVGFEGGWFGVVVVVGWVGGGGGGWVVVVVGGWWVVVGVVGKGGETPQSSKNGSGTADPEDDGVLKRCVWGV